ncbi:hypothetical protein B8V81_2849 [Paenibacillus pasadenensis]|uniref:Uncharacterized protein n=1 Tax=Paenibacillus pasadenensis TaxID=217090 RepID=A0A2N5N251_9BACL|nr:hypothetical protein B8V81_2849 [Paenibacillus pasadenensis]
MGCAHSRDSAAQYDNFRQPFLQASFSSSSILDLIGFTNRPALV